MREPKFRGYSKETNSWHYGHGWFKTDLTEEYKQEKGIEDSAILYTDGSPIECELKSMGQYTGLKGENGKEIFENDICKNMLGIKGFIVFNVDKGGYYIENKEGFFKLSYHLEVLGNIYEDTELIR